MTANVHALAGFLDVISFDFFCTFTTRKPIGVKTCRRHADKVLDFVRKDDSETSFFWAAEKFELTEGAGSNRFHWHALLKSQVDKYKLFNWYFQKFGRCQIIDNREPDRQAAASYYCSKYMVKSLGDYDIHLSSRDRGLQKQFNFNTPC
jgi:hypothetical protein